MGSIIPKYEYDIFISYRHNDNRSGWVTDFVKALEEELAVTIKEPVSLYFDTNPNDGLLETHIVNKSLEGKLNCLIFIPVISQTYCDIKSYAWEQEFCAFNKLAKEDQFGRDIKFSNGNVASRILPVKIHDLDQEDKKLLETELGGSLRAVDFIYKEAGVNRPLKLADNKYDNLNKTDYRNQVNKVANAIKEIIASLKKPASSNSKIKEDAVKLGRGTKVRLRKPNTLILFAVISLIILTVVILSLNKFYSSAKSPKTEYTGKITSNPIAYDWYSKAKFRLTPENKDDVDSSILFLTKAIDADPKFALAHAELAYAYALKNFWHDPNSGYSEKAFMEAQKSLYLEPNLAEGLFAEAFNTWTFQNKFPHEKVIREYKRVIALKPEMDDAYHQLARIYVHVGLMDEALIAYNKALQINPDNMEAFLDKAGFYSLTWKKTDMEYMIDLYKQIPEHQISEFRANFWIIALIALDRTGEAENVLSVRMKKDTSNIFLKSDFAVLLAKKGDKTGAFKEIELCEKSNFNASHLHHAVYNLAEAYALLGNYQESVEKLVWVADNGWPNYVCFRDDPLLISLHQFPPYIELMKKLKTSCEKFRKIANE